MYECVFVLVEMFVGRRLMWCDGSKGGFLVLFVVEWLVCSGG